MVLYSKKEDCCGCSACKSICPKSAIQMLPDEEGFLYPAIDQDKCVDCRICVQVCAFRNGYNISNNFKEPLVYAVRHKDLHEVETSRSGAMFIALSDYILENNGVIYGVGYTDHFRVVHKRAVTKSARNEFKGSKYVQSDINGVFDKVKADLLKGLLVLFSGTPCQTAGLYAYLENVCTEKLYVCDIVCTGVASPAIFNDYLNYLKNKYKDKIIGFNFRDKCRGWKTQEESFFLQGEGKRVFKKTFAILFGKKAILRPSCGYCVYANIRRPSDITLGDYWGWERISSSLNVDDKGVSLVLVNTKKGQTIFHLVVNKITYLESCVENCLQNRLTSPASHSPVRKIFWNEYRLHGFIYIVKKYSDLGLSTRLQKWKKKFKSIFGSISF